jgi:hypothetical protein
MRTLKRNGFCYIELATNSIKFACVTEKIIVDGT